MKFYKKIIITMLILISILQICSPVAYGWWWDRPEPTPIVINTIIDIDIPPIDLPGVIGDDHNEENNDKQTELDKKYPIDGPSSGNSGEAMNPILVWATSLLYYPAKLVISIVREICQLISKAITGKDITPQEIIFNEVEMVNINFFSEESKNSPQNSFVKQLREGVANWYALMRNLAIIASLCVLLYIAIRMAISTVAEKEAKYKKMLKNWFMSFALIFVIHYIMIFIIYGNNTLVSIIKQGVDNKLVEYLKAISDMAWTPNTDVLVYQQFGADIVALIIYALTIVFLVMYLRRVIIIAFLMIISPLVTITYSIDKIGDGKSQAFNSWFKEFLWTILVQPFHCIIYVVIVSTSLNLLDNASFASSVMSIYCMIFLLQAENIIKRIFGISSDNAGGIGSGTAFVAGMMTRTSGSLKKINKLKKDMAQLRDDRKQILSLKDKENQNKDTHSAGGSTEGNKNGGTDEKVPSSSMDSQSGSDKLKDNTYKSSRVSTAMDKLSGVVGKVSRGRTGKVIGGVFKTSKFMAKMGLGASTAALAALKGDLSLSNLTTGFVGGYKLGGKIEKGVDNRLRLFGNKITSTIGPGARLKNIAQEFNEEYRNYQGKGKGAKKAEDILQQAEVLIDIDLSSAKLNSAERRFAEVLQRYVKQYMRMGYSRNTAKTAVQVILEQKVESEKRKRRRKRSGGNGSRN